MAFDAKDIGRLRAAVPPAYQPPHHAAGALTIHFSSADSLRESAPMHGSEIAERERNNLGLAFIGRGITQSAPSFLLSGAQAVRTIQINETEKRKRGDDIRFALDQAKAALVARLAELDAELAAIDKRLEEIRQRRIVIADQLEALDDIEQIRRSGKKLDARNPAHRRLLEAAGISEYDANGDGYALVISQRRHALGNEDEALGTEHNSLLKYRGVVAYERQGVVGALDEIENADTEEARILAERRATITLGAQQLGEAAYQTDSDRAKLTAADAVAANEQSPSRADSQTFARSATTKDDSLVASEGVATFKLG